MKKHGKRLLSSFLSLVMVLTLLPTIALADESSSTTNTSSGISTGSSAFGLPEATGLVENSDEYQKAVQDAPYGSSGNVVPLFVKSELYMTYGWSGSNRYTHVFDYNQDNTDGKKNTILHSGIFESLGNAYRTKFSSAASNGSLVVDTAAVNAGSGKQEYVAVLGLGRSESYLELRNKDDTSASNSILLGGKSYLTDYAYELGGFAAVAAGDFDGNGVDSIVYYNPPASGGTDAVVCESTITAENGTVTINASAEVLDVYTQLGSAGGGTAAKDIPVVQLEAADVDKDGYDELIVTAGRNDVASSDTACGTQVFILDKLETGWTVTAHYAPTAATGFAMDSSSAASAAKRYVWSTSSVGNVIVSDDSSTGTDFPEIVTAGWVDTKSGKDIELDEKTLGVMMVHCTGMTEAHKGQANYQGKYELAYRTTLEANGWTQAGCYDEDDRNSLLQVKCFNYQGGAQAEAIFLSGSVYTYQNNNGSASLGEAYTYNYFNSGDSYIGSTKITNKQIQSVAVGNFDGNGDGREQVVFANLVKKSGGTQHYVSFYVYGNVGGTDGWQGTEVDGWPVRGEKGAYVSLTDFDYDDDGILVKYEGVERVWENCDILAILELQPYFAELGDDYGEGHTAYGKSSSTGSGSENSHGFSLGLITGFETEVAGFGGGFEATVDNSFTWSTNVSRTEEHSITYENQTGENIVVVYRTPVLVYTYKNISNGNDMFVAKTLAPQTASITVESYNEQAEANGLPLIDESKLATAGDPFSYPSNQSQIENAGGTNVTLSNTGWTALSNTNTEKSIVITNETEDSFSYDLDINVSVWGIGFGAKYGFSAGYSYSHGKTTMNGVGTEYSGSVMGPTAPGYDFQWNFAMWNMVVGGRKVPVLGYLVQGAAAPASPPTAVDVDYSKLTSSSARLTWEQGTRPAAEYRIYRVLSDGSHSYLTSVDGDVTECTINGLGANMTYTFVLRAVLNGVESVDSEGVTFTTPKEGGKSYVTIGKVEDKEINAGESATFSANVTKSDQNVDLTMQWQERSASSGEWKDIAGASGNTYTVSNAKLSQDGTKYRLRIAATPLTENTPIYYFSNAATLSVGPLATNVSTVSVTASGNSSGSGTLSAPYTGLSSWSLAETKKTTIDVDEPYTFTVDGKKGTVYAKSDESSSVYLGIVSGENGAKTYYALTEDDSSVPISFTASGDALDFVYVTEGGAEVSDMQAEWADSVYTTEVDTAVYTAVATRDESTVTLYWEKDGTYYTYDSTDGYKIAENMEPNYLVCYYSVEGDTWLLRDLLDDTRTSTSEGGATTETTAYLTLIEDGTATEKIKPDGYLNLSESYYLPSDFVVHSRSVEKEIKVPTTTPQAGTALTLSATVASGDNALVGQSAFFLITNTADGMSYRVDGTTGADGKLTGTWTAPTAGLYSIRAGVNASTNYRASASDMAVYYAAVKKNDAGVEQSTTYVAALIGGENGINAGSSVEYGTTLYFKTYTVRAIDGTPNGEAKDVTLRLPGGTEKTVTAGETYAPDRAGQYAVIEKKSENGKTTEISKLLFTVTPIKLTVTPTLKGNVTVPNNLGDFTLTLTGALEGDKTSLTSLLSVKDENGYFGGAGGVFTFTPVWSTSAADAENIQRLTSAYSVTLESISLRREQGKLPVTYMATGGHGTLYGSYGSSLTSFTSGTQLAEGTKLVFQANPETGYRVDSWKINGTVLEGNDLRIAQQTGTNVQTLTIDSLTKGSEGQLTVEATFTAQFSAINFSVNGENGTLSARTGDGTVSGTPITSGTQLTYGSSVTFTAAPSENYMINGWTVNGETYCWPNTTKPYQETTLTLSGLSLETYEVKVSFAQKAAFTVAAPKLMTADETPVTTGSISITNAANNAAVEAGSSVTKGTVLTYTVTFNDPSFNTVSGWEYSTDGTNWVSGGSGASFTVYSADLTFGESSALQVRAVVSVSQKKTLNWTLSDPDSIGAALAVTSGSGSSTVELTSGGSYPVGTVVTFTLTLNGIESCETVWSENVTPSEDGLSATLTLSADSVVTVTVKKHTPGVTAPTAITGLVYNGEEQTLIAAGSTTGGTLKYSLNGEDWETELPAGRDAKDYTVYYKVEGDASYIGVEEQHFDVTIEKKELAVSAGSYKVSKVYDGTTNAGTADGVLSVTGILNNDAVTVTATPAAYANANVGGQSSMDVTLSLTGDDTNNYKLASNTVSVPCEITKAALTVSGTASATASYGTKVKEIPIEGLTVERGGTSVQGAWSFGDVETVPNVGDTTAYTATFTPSTGVGNYEALTMDITPTITKIDPVVPSNLFGYRNGALSTVTLPDGWSWVDGTAVMTEAGEKTFAANYAGSTNYNAKDNVTLTVNVTDKANVSADITFADGSLTYAGSALSFENATISGVSGGSWTYTYAAGTGTLRDGKPLTAGTYTVTAQYEDETHIGVATVTLTVDKATPTGEPKYTAITTSGKTLADAALTTEGGTFSVPGSVKWIDADGNDLTATTEVAANTAYKWLFMPTDSTNYNTLDGSITLYRVSTPSGGGSSSGSTSSSTTSTTVTVPVSSDHASVEVKAEVSKGNATVEISDKQIENVIADHAGEVTIDVSDLKNVESATVPSHVIEKTNEAENTGLTVALPAGSVTLDETALGSVTENANGKDVAVSVVSVPTTNLPPVVKEIIGMEPTVVAVVDVNVTIGGKKQSSFDGGKVTISVPYTPKKGEDTGKLTVWFIRDDGTIENKGGYYDAAKKCFVFETEHLSQYLLVNTNELVSFTDVPANAYYAAAVNWAVGKNITNGIGDGKFGPDLSCTRGQIVTFLYRCALAQGVDVGVGESTNILSYTDALEVPEFAFEAFQWAVGAGIIQGADGKLMPNDDCTRAQIVTMLYRYAVTNGKDVSIGEETNILSYADAFEVPEYAAAPFRWACGANIIQGADGKLMPNDTCTRAQIVTMLYRANG